MYQVFYQVYPLHICHLIQKIPSSTIGSSSDVVLVVHVHSCKLLLPSVLKA